MLESLRKRKRIFGVVVAVVMLAAIFNPFQTVEAFTVNVEFPDGEDTVSQSPAGTPFTITINVQTTELISVESITLLLDNDDASVKIATFDSDGDFVSGSNNLVIGNSLTTSVSSNTDYGYGYGLGLVSDGTTFVAPYSYSFLSNNGFIGGNSGSSTTGGVTEFVTGLLGPGSITIEGILRTANLAEGDHALDVLIDTGANGNGEDQLVAPTFNFTIEEDDSVVVTDQPVTAGANSTNIATTDSDGDPINVVLNFGTATTTSGNAVVTVQNVDDFIAGKTAGQLQAQGFAQSGGQLQFTTDDDDNEFIAVGFIMDIDLSALGLPEGTLVTLEMDYDDTDLSPSEENRVRLMHQLDTLDEWEALTNDDPTINGGDEVDTDANIVYGTTDDFSLFGPAVRETVSIDDDDDDGSSGGGGGGGGGSRSVTITWPTVQTKDDAYFFEHPLERVLVANSAFVNAGGVSIDTAQVGQQVSIAGEFTNYQGKEQTYAYIVQVINENDEVVSIAWQQGSLASGSTASVSTLWTPEIAGDYEVKIFVWNRISGTPEPLSEVTVKNISVS